VRCCSSSFSSPFFFSRSSVFIFYDFIITWPLMAFREFSLSPRLFIWRPSFRIVIVHKERARASCGDRQTGPWGESPQTERQPCCAHTHTTRCWIARNTQTSIRVCVYI
jgi:hypothetical protein